VRPGRIILIGFVSLFSAFAADPGLGSTLKAVENRYNRAKTLQVSFHEAYTPPGKPQRVEAGTLLLRKPGRMRWDYSQPQGKLFISDGKFLWLYVPADNRAEKMKFQLTEDMRAPLAFLLGKLNFDKEFRNIVGQPDKDGTRITAEPKTDNLPYSRVEFVVTAENRIRQVKVTGFDKAVLDFSFDQEQMNPSLDSKLFQFQVPPGATVVEASQ
jgi:outer membrane lipoprotein carrier protein